MLSCTSVLKTQSRKVFRELIAITARLWSNRWGPLHFSLESEFALMHDPWDSYRLRRSLFFLSIFAAPMLGLFGFVIGMLIGEPSSDMTGQVAAGIGLLAFAASGIALTVWRCPRCQNQFFCRWWMSNHFADKCAHCELEKWTQPENQPTDE